MAIEKKYLTFQELLIRWDCEKKDIHYMIMEEELIPSIFWDDLVYLMQWQPNRKKPSRLILHPQKAGRHRFHCVHMMETFHLRIPTKTGVLKYHFAHGTLELNEVIKESGKPWYRLAYGSEDGSTANINQDEIESNCVFMLEGIENIETLGDVPERLNAIVVNEKLTELQEVEKLLKDRERNSLYRIIAALCATLLNENSRNANKAFLKNQSALIDYLDQTYDGYEGISKANLEKVLAAANKLIQP